MSSIKLLLDNGTITKEQLNKRFEKKISRDGLLKDGFTQCWKALGTLSSSGYGQMYLYGQIINTHRFSYMLHNDLWILPEKYVIAHKCDNKVCCNPEHLECVPYSKNSKDAYDRGCVISHIPKIKKKVSVACTNCHTKKCKCIQFGEKCERCESLGLDCVIGTRTAKKGDFKKGEKSGENNIKCKLSKERFSELVERLKNPIERGKMKEVADDFGIGVGYLQQIKGKLKKGIELRTDVLV